MSRIRELKPRIAAAISQAEEAARLDEREACLAVAELELAEWTNETRMHKPIESIIARIRSRGPATTAPDDETHEWVAESHSGVGSRFHDEPAADALTYSSPPGKLVAKYRRVDAPDALLEAANLAEEAIASLTAERDALKAELLGQVMGPTDGELDIIAQLEKERDALKAERDDLRGKLFMASGAIAVMEGTLASAESARNQAVEKLGEALAERDSYAKQWRLVTKACDSALVELGEARAEQRVVSDGFFEAANRASLMLKRAESAEQALRALREAVRETIGQLQWSLPVGSFDELAKALAESEEKA